MWQAQRDSTDGARQQCLAVAPHSRHIQGERESERLSSAGHRHQTKQNCFSRTVQRSFSASAQNRSASSEYKAACLCPESGACAVQFGTRILFRKWSSEEHERSCECFQSLRDFDFRLGNGVPEKMSEAVCAVNLRMTVCCLHFMLWGFHVARD